jgi:uncharacterized protein YndB with AHSA1/START domain/DNA-binding transcriptional ArsR family regulator
MADSLSLTFSALSDPTRRAILARVASSGETSVIELGKPFAMSLPAVSKHLKVLERAGLIQRGRAAQWRPWRLVAGPLKDAADWLDEYRRYWEESFDRLDDYLKELRTKDKRILRGKEKKMAAGSNAVVAEPQEHVLVIERIFDAPRDLVYKCWTESEHLRRWTGPRGFSTIVHAYDFRPGGHLRLHMRAPDGTEHWQSGTFREIVPPERIVRTFVWTDAEGNPTRPETVLSLTFEELGGRTRLTLHQAGFKSVIARDEHRGGWSSSLDLLAEYLATTQKT